MWSAWRSLKSISLTVGLVAGCAPHSVQPVPRAVPPPNPDLTAQDVDRLAPGQPVEQMLMDRFPGVEVVSRPGGGVAIRIRGPASFYGSSDPLLVVDGVTLDVGANNLSWLNPHDISSITVLKNPSETAIYGVRGANGVIVVTTKRPGTGK
jgi:TonB-dependent SusC/RagA subfamily outer membrane receptor